jgi:hypothetical protein
MILNSIGKTVKWLEKYFYYLSEKRNETDMFITL